MACSGRPALPKILTVYLLWCIAGAWALPLAYAEIRVVPAFEWHNIYGGRSTTFTYNVSAEEPLSGIVRWHLSHDQRTIRRGEQSITLEPGQLRSVAISLDIPPVDDGKVIALSLAVSVSDGNNGAAEAANVNTIWVFDAQPFKNHFKITGGFDTFLFDPVGKTAEMIVGPDVPVRLIKDVDQLFTIKNSLIIIGEGTDLDKTIGLVDALNAAAVAGNGVLCLAPKRGTIPLIGAVDRPHQVPARITVQDYDVIESIDKRLDSRMWYPGQSPEVSGISFEKAGPGICFSVKESGGQWPWAEKVFPGKGSLVICGFGIIRDWRASPSAPYLMAAVLAEMAGRIRQ